ncbi:hypothetical protein AMECASPLE_011286, partial [Ameca splendens]
TWRCLLLTLENNKVSAEFVREWTRRNGSCVREAPDKRPRSPETNKVLASIIVISSSSDSKEELVQDRLRKRKASPDAELSEKR